MKKIDNTQYIWTEKYRPRNIDDLIIPNSIKDQLLSYKEEEHFPHMLLSSIEPGLGKTSMVHSLVEDLDADVKWINGSQDRGIDTFKIEVRNFIMSRSIDDSLKVVVIDEADGLTKDAQKMLRGLIEEFSKYSVFILTCNYKEQLVEPLRNRLIHFDFDELYNNSKKEIGLQIFNRLKFILKEENIEYDSVGLPNVITALYPSVRAMILFLQQNTLNNKLNIEGTINLESKYKNLLEMIKENKYAEFKDEMVKVENPSSFYSYVFKNLETYFVGSSIPHVIILCAKYQDMSTTARDKTITSTAFGIEIMVSKEINFRNSL